MPSPSGGDTKFDVTVFGATSFVGQLVVDYLLEREGDDLRWAVAGRNKSKLEQLLADRHADVPIVVADAADRRALDSMVADSSVIISTVGPYALYGSELIASVVAAGIDYCDLTGEPLWVQTMIDTHCDEAVATGARIVPSCGFDSIPSDLGVWFTQRQAMEQFDQPCQQVAMRVKAIKGGVSGGTVASGLNAVEEVSKNPSLRKALANPYSLAPSGQRSGVRQPNVMTPTNDKLSGSWLAPFIMASVNTKVVHRTHALLGRPWGDGFLYDEAVMTGAGPAGLARATAVTAGMATLAGVSAVGPVRRQLEQRVLPKPGMGPDSDTRQAGFFDIRFFGETADGRTISTKVTGDRDPGYGSTAKMLSESALALLESRLAHGSTAGGDPPYGFLTPTVALGDALIERLTAKAGLTFSVLD